MRATQVRDRAELIAKSIREFYIDSARKGLRFNTITLETFLAARPAFTKDLAYLDAIGMCWSHLVDASRIKELDVDGMLKADVRKAPDPFVLKSGAHSVRIEKKLKDYSRCLKSLVESFAKTGDKPKYISRDVFLAMFPAETPSLEYLDSIGINWHNILLLSGLDCYNYKAKEAKKTAALSFRCISEIFGISVRHLTLLQRLINHMANEEPEQMSRFFSESLGTSNPDAANIALQNLSGLIQYFRSIE